MANKNIIFLILQICTCAIFTHAGQIPIAAKPQPSNAKEPTVRIQCMTGMMLITIKNAPSSHENNLFSGMIYPKGLSKNSTCLTEFRDHNGPLKYKLPLRSCNTMPQETDDGAIEFFNTIVLQPHLKLVTDLGRGYHVRCRYNSRKAATPPQKRLSEFDQTPEALTSLEDDTDVANDRRDYGRSLDLSQAVDEVNDNEIPMPGCHMKIFSGNSIAENVRIGDILTLVINIDKQENYGLHITDCLVRDGLGWGEQRLINDQGCPMDSEIMGPFNYTTDREEATVTFPAHKFPYTTSVYYQCNVKLCSLKDADCQKAPDCSNAKKRPKRENAEEESPATIEVYSGLYVNENSEVIEGDDSVLKEKTPDDALCVSQRSFAIAVAIAGLILMLIVVAAVLCIMARRHRKSGTNSGSSIYSGPYTNTAFSQSS